MAKFRKKPVIIEAVQWHKGDLPLYCMIKEMTPEEPRRYGIQTLEGFMIVSDGDWIITGDNGEKYPCKPDIFEKTYEPVES